MKMLHNLIRILTLTLLAMLASLTVFAATPAAHKGEYILFVGTDSQKDSASKGIYAYSYDARTGKTTPLGLAAETLNPSWITLSADGRFLYAVNEEETGHLSAFSIERGKDGRPTGKLTFLNQVVSHGADPCYLTIDKTGKFALVANYTSGNLYVVRIRADGSFGDGATVMFHSGHGANPQRQSSPHIHSVDLSPDNRFAYVDDLGIDSLIVYKFDDTRGQLAGSLTGSNSKYPTFDPGSGPRHFVLSPSGKFAYVVSELLGTVSVFSNDPATGTLQRLQTISTLPQDFKGEIADAEIAIHPSGKFLYASNRGDGNSIAVFAIDADKGTLTLVDYKPSQGKTPSSFAIDPTGTLLFVGNENSNNIVIFRIDQKTGRLTPTGQVLDANAPACLKFLKIE
jgi:6-phosphogluconolactonase